MNNISQLLKAGLQSGSIMLVSDCIVQLGVEKKNYLDHFENDQSKRHPRYDAKYEGEEERLSFDSERSLRWSIAGLMLHGPYFFYSFSKLDRYFGTTTTMKNVLKKTLCAQLVVFPPYLVALFGFMGFMEGNKDVFQKIQNKVPDAFIGGSLFWPMANVINFKLIPSHMRVPYLAGVGSLWNCFLSWLNG